MMMVRQQKMINLNVVLTPNTPLFSRRLFLLVAIGCVLLFTTSARIIRAQNSSVTFSPGAVTIGSGSLTVTFTADVDVLQALGTVTFTGPASCSLSDSSQLGTITMPAPTLHSTGSGVKTIYFWASTGTGTFQIQSGYFEPGTYTVTCSVTFDVSGDDVTADATSTTSVVLSGTGVCNATEGTAKVQAPPASGGDDPPTYDAAISLPYTLSPGGAGTFPTQANGTSDTSPYIDCDGDTIYGQANAPTVTNGAVAPAEDDTEVTMNWTITPYGWSTPGADCDCTDCDPNTCSTSGIDDPSTVVSQALTPFPYTNTATCTF